MTRLRPAALLLLAALPGAAWAACNPVGTEDCCTKIETPECEEVDWPEADGIDVSGTCSSVAFELVGLTPGRYTKKTTVEWIANDPSVECPTNQIRLEEFTFEANVTWRITENGVTVKTGGGTFAESPDPVSGSIGCTFTLSSDAGICGENSEDYSASTNLPVASVTIPPIIGSNDLVEPCEDEVDPVTSVEELHDDEDDLYNVTWSCSPDPEEVTITAGPDAKLILHIDDDGELAHIYHYPEMSRTEPIWAEGLLRSDVPNDAFVSMVYTVDGVTCETSNFCTVVSVDLDRDAYNRMDPFPQVEITQVENLVTGQTATVRYRVLPDLATPEGAVLQATFQVSTDPGTHEWRTPPFRNRFGNEGWDALRYTVYVAENGEKRIRKGESTPSHKALVEPPPECLATVQTGDALALEADAIFGHLTSTPVIQTPRKATGIYPDWKVEDIKLFKRTADHYYTNEMVLAELGTTAVREILWGETQDTAVGLELTCDPVVCVNDLYEDGDPGDNAATNQVWTDPDFIGPVELDGIPDCIATGSYQWQITGDANLVIREDDEALFVGQFYEGRYEDGIKYPKIEGRESSRVKDDVEIRFLLQVDPSEENPKAFRGAELPASAKLTVADTRWTLSKPDGEAGRSAERTDLLSCDLDLRPCIALDSFDPVFATNLAVSGVVTSMCDIVRDIRVNGAQVPMTNIRFRDESVENFNDATIKEKTWGLDPPYVVTFDYTIPDFRTNVVFVEAFGTRTAVPGRHRTAVSFPTNAVAGTNGLCGAPQADPVSKNLSFEDFYRQDWDFLYKFEVDHAGSGSGILECQPDLTCGSQGIDREYHRLELPMLFFPPDTPPAISRIGKGFLTNLVDMASVTGRYETATGRDSISKLFPCQLTVYGMDNRPVPDCDEWWLGAFCVSNGTVRLEVSNPFGPKAAEDSALTLELTKNEGDVFAGFQTKTWNKDKPPSGDIIELTARGTGTAEFVLSMSGGGVTSKDRVKITCVRVDLDVDSDNDLSMEDADGFEESIESFWPGKILCVNGEGFEAGRDYLAPMRMRTFPASVAPGCQIRLDAVKGTNCVIVWEDESKTRRTGLSAAWLPSTPTLGERMLQVDGVETGRVQFVMSYLGGDETPICSNLVTMLIIPPISYAPGCSSNAVIWCSLPSLGTNDATEFIGNITNQGFNNVVWYLDSTGATDTDVGECTLSNYRNISNFGAVNIISHGGMDCHYPVYFEWTDAGRTAASNWIAGELNMDVEEWDDEFVVRVDKPWFSANWKNDLDANRALVMWSTCYSASLLDVCGGRWRTGYILPTCGDECCDVNREFLGRLNGELSAATCRTAGEALEDRRDGYRQINWYDYVDGSVRRHIGSVLMEGNPWTTLCPSPLLHDSFFPEHIPPGQKKIFGCLLLDTYINPGVAGDTLEKAALACSPDGQFSNFKWLRQATGEPPYGIGFTVDVAPAAFKVESRHENLRNFGTGGGRSADMDRIQPNETDNEWSF